MRASVVLIVVTYTAPFRHAGYHTSKDLPGELDFGRLAQVVDGLAAVIVELADGP